MGQIDYPHRLARCPAIDDYWTVVQHREVMKSQEQKKIMGRNCEEITALA
jgi:hypothetical protein